MALTLPGHRRFAPMFKIAPGDFLHFAVLPNALWAVVASFQCSKSLQAILCILQVKNSYQCNLMPA